jgi:hypothetical protein
MAQAQRHHLGACHRTAALFNRPAGCWLSPLLLIHLLEWPRPCPDNWSPQMLPQKDKKCNVASPIAKGLPTGQGSYTWTPGQATPGATYQIQLLELVGGSNPKTYAASGKSSGYFQVSSMPCLRTGRPRW